MADAASPAPAAAGQPQADAPTRTVFPTAFLTHGGGPMYFMEMPKNHPRFSWSAGSKAAQWLREFRTRYNLVGANAPKAIVVVSAHWITQGKVVHITNKAQHTKLLYDYGGFPPETYKLQYAPPGNPALSKRIHDLFTTAGVSSKLDSQWEFDHGVFILCKLMWPEADIPIVELSIDASYDPAYHVRVGQALQSLKHEGVLLIGSGSSTHNFSPDAAANRRFIAGLRAALEAPKAGADDAAFEERTKKAALEWTSLPEARNAHPEEDHYVPLMVALGAAGKQVAKIVGESEESNTWSLCSVLFESK